MYQGLIDAVAVDSNVNAENIGTCLLFSFQSVLEVQLLTEEHAGRTTFIPREHVTI